MTEPAQVLLLSVLASPFFRGSNSFGLVLLPVFGNVVCQRIVGVGGTEEGLYREQDGTDLERGRPLVLQNIKADSSELVNVGVIDLC